MTFLRYEGKTKQAGIALYYVFVLKKLRDVLEFSISFHSIINKGSTCALDMSAVE